MGFTVLLLALLPLLIAGTSVACRSRDQTGGMPDPDAETDTDRNVERSLTDAAACLRAARAELAAARTPAQYAQVTRTAVAGLHHVRRARAALGPAPQDALRCRTSRPRAGRSPAGPDTARPTAPPRPHRSAVRTAHRHG